MLLQALIAARNSCFYPVSSPDMSNLPPQKGHVIDIALGTGMHADTHSFSMVASPHSVLY